MPAKTASCCRQFSCKKKFTPHSWRRKHIKLHPSREAGYATGNKPSGAERCTRLGTPAYLLTTKSQRRGRVLKRSLSWRQPKALQTCLGSMACSWPRVWPPTSSRAVCLFYVRLSDEWALRIHLSRQGTPPAGSQPMENAWRGQRQGSRCRTLVAQCSVRIQYVPTYSLHREGPPNPDLLHTMPISLLNHLEGWISHCMNTHKWLNKYNAILLSIPAYHDLTPKNKSNEEVSQFNGKEIK